MRSHLYLLRACVAILFLSFVCAPVASAADKQTSYRTALESIKSEHLAQLVDYLAGSELEGREAGTRGGRAAGDYLVQQYTQIHLRAAGAKDQFYQPFASFRNVLAMLPGSDPKLRDRVIVVCAHYDHVGYGGWGSSLDGYGQIHPGADDNASGTAMVVELARALALLATPPKRSILFANWDAEEKGLLGSRQWVDQPTIPLDRVAAAVNLDMVGRLRDDWVTVYGSRSGCGWRRLLSSHNGDGLQLDFSWSIEAKADHYPLFARGIPVLMLHTGMHEDYHRSTDLAERINTAGMAQITKLLFRLVYELADAPAVPAYRAAARRESPATEKAILGRAARPPDRLGVGWPGNGDAAGGIRLDLIAQGSPAERAGLQAGDLVVRFAGRDIRTGDDLCGAVSAAASPVPVTVIRSGQAKPLELTVNLAGSPLRWGMLWRADDAEPGAVTLTYVVAGSPAAQAGLLPGDRIYQVGGRDFADQAAFAQLAATLPDSLQLLVEHNGRTRTVVLRQYHVQPAKRAA